MVGSAVTSSGERRGRPDSGWPLTRRLRINGRQVRPLRCWALPRTRTGLGRRSDPVFFVPLALSPAADRGQGDSSWSLPPSAPLCGCPGLRRGPGDISLCHLCFGHFLIMEFPDLGKHCSEKTCKQLDFLPLECDACKQDFCKDHFTYAAHKCPFAFKKDVQVPVCPLCNSPVPVKKGEIPDVVVGAHMDGGCKRHPGRKKEELRLGNVKDVKSDMGIPALAVWVLVLKSRVCPFGVRSGRLLHWGICLPHGPELQLAFVSFALGWWEMPVPTARCPPGSSTPAAALLGVRWRWCFSRFRCCSGSSREGPAVLLVPACGSFRLATLPDRESPSPLGSRSLGLYLPGRPPFSPQVPFSLCDPRAGGLSHVVVSRAHAPGPQLTARVLLPATRPPPGSHVTRAASAAVDF
ncbi:hypothetical protein J1605_019559 [Eschrichtius robustus]|uniref:AN1-type domain-containing protein n=1 Tax=Eschrichtius robustus TaxID=9764 RepID=A0AB34HQC0_ESCRO|nr:hypothetical protein J1605_019559 [Eschrichtius robustus]